MQPSPSHSAASIPQVIASQLQQEILSNCQPGERLPTVDQLARRFKVSRHSISMALGILAREGMIEKAPKRGICVASKPSRATVGIYCELDLLSYPNERYFSSLLAHARRQLESEGFDAFVYLGRCHAEERPAESTCPQFIADLRRGSIQALIIVTSAQTDEWHKRWKSLGIPVVGDPMTEDRLYHNTPEMLRAGLEALAAQGCRKVAMLGWGQSAPIEDFVVIASKLGLRIDPNLVRNDLHPLHPGSAWEEFREVWMASKDSLDGLLLTDDVLLPDVVQSILSMNISVPDRLRIATMTNGPLLFPLPFPATLLEVNVQACADILVKMLMRKLGRRSLGPVSRKRPFTVKAYRPGLGTCDLPLSPITESTSPKAKSFE